MTDEQLKAEEIISEYRDHSSYENSVMWAMISVGQNIESCENDPERKEYWERVLSFIQLKQNTQPE